MTQPVIIRPAAEADIEAAARWYNDRQANLGRAFLAEVDATLLPVAENPARFLRLRRRPEVRRALTRRFHYRVFFIRRPDALVVIRVLHGAREDRQWRDAIEPSEP